MTDQEKIAMIIPNLNVLSEEDASLAGELLDAADAGTLTPSQRTEFDRIYDICKDSS
jgi:hypothetical protein|tara:strand:- start:771 stop:941 length:171 start_codon:yes stop_codon:yes gene_type:complete